jgi:predicted transcriptional regulator
MKKEYDFSRGERGKFYHPNAKMNLPIYLSPSNLDFVVAIAKKKRLDLSTVVNNLLKGGRQIAETIE